ncbi:MAG: DNA polymerase III subunit gamma/tau [Isosphaeraceae bacterium]|nr:DNA polymerase III subunit gamma/tau [Isosphaeraceae bacterium]
MAKPAAAPGAYTVVARRYRPQRFEDVVGQDHVVQALRNAIRLNRVTHAYLFSGTRGVGKTSMARIFAKCLNCARGPTDQPDLTCDICQAIAAGQDVDVIEIDGASNNGVDAVRELRQNAGLRPSRSRFKIYYIDEVHMLSTGAFNALLKTLEEPPEHVKFLFATTEPNKIPVTVLSRCQRFDFAAISPEQIAGMLTRICEQEGIAAEPEALQVVARRAGGSMRDAESLLEQLLSSGDRHLTTAKVHELLGIAADDRLLDLIEAMAGHDLARVLSLVDDTIRSSGVQPPDLLSGVLEFLRDAMVLKAGADVALLAAPPAAVPRLRAIVERWELDSILAAQQIVAEARGRLRGSPHGRLLVELALCRVTRLEDLAELGTLVERLEALEAGTPVPPMSSLKKKLARSESEEGKAGLGPAGRSEPARSSAPSSALGDGAPLTCEAVLAAWPDLVRQVGAPFGAALDKVRPRALEGPKTVAIPVPIEYNWVARLCDTPDARAKIEAALLDLLGRPLTVRFEREAPPATPAPARAADLASDPLVQKVVELLEARPIHLEVDEGSAER